MKTTAALAALLLLAAAGCQEPPRLHRLDAMVMGLAHLQKWDIYMQARGNLTYDQVMGYGPEIFPVLAAHLTDETPTQIYEEVTRRNPTVSDISFLMLLELTKTKWQDFASEGVFVSTALPNPVFCIKWDRTAKIRVQAKFMKLLEPAEDP